ncbi:TIGR03086 family metal-binding protein [Nakamurella lactea]|uniref:TIGR03086 family metal-binding protein n=1 Tax=Nakamurella lactea TaxID=459515 RepID=UPI000416D8F8|nr:TIGR03086 family metal-binding protein [Nakamurella lactea]
MHDLAPAATRMSALITAIDDDALAGRTPCTEYSLGDLVEHVGGLAQAFTDAATKDIPPGGSQAPHPDGSRLEAGWRLRIASDLDRLGAAWQQPDAWAGMTEAGGVPLPGEVAGLVALNELVLHGWDLARASGQEYRPAEIDLRVCSGLLAPFSGPDPQAARPPIYGPEVQVPTDASLLDRLLGMAGRDPHWGTAEVR